jgi:hypothetical protein
MYAVCVAGVGFRTRARAACATLAEQRTLTTANCRWAHRRRDSRDFVRRWIMGGGPAVSPDDGGGALQQPRRAFYSVLPAVWTMRVAMQSMENKGCGCACVRADWSLR